MSDSSKNDSKEKSSATSDTAKKLTQQSAKESDVSSKPSSDTSKQKRGTTSTTASTTTTSATTKSTAVKTSKIPYILLWAVVLSILIALVVTIYVGWQFMQQQKTSIQALQSELDTQTQQQSAQVSSAVNRQSTLLDQQKQLFEKFKSQVEHEQKSIQKRLENHTERLQTLTGNSRTIWILEEARYLLRLANQRQLTGGNASGILGLLEEADKLLLSADTPDVFTIRNSLRKDILAIRVAPKVDREGLYLQLSALSAQLSSMPAAPVKKLVIEQPENKADKQAGLPWYYVVLNSIKNAFSNLDKYVQVNQHSQPIEPLLSRQQQGMMITNLLLMMEQAQAALLKEEQVVYRQSLTKVINWLNAHYLHFEQTPALIDEIKTLQSKNVVSIVPTISSSLKLLGDYIKQQDQTDNTSATTKKEKINKQDAKKQQANKEATL